MVIIVSRRLGIAFGFGFGGRAAKARAIEAALLAGQFATYKENV